MKALTKISDLQQVEPILRKVLIEAENEHHELEEVFELMGWEGLPEDLKIEIKEDIKAFRDELTGYYSTCDPFVQRRRQRIDYWVRSFNDGVCSLKTAVNALRVRPL